MEVAEPLILPVGLDSWLVEVHSLPEVHSLAGYLVALRERGLLAATGEIVPGARTVLLDGQRLDRSRARELVEGWRRGADGDAERPRAAGSSPAPVEIPVTYEGADLDEVASLRGLTPRDVIDLHTGTEFTVAFCGFSAGFAYLEGLPAALRVPRRTTPRTMVPAGAVAVAEQFTAVYPRPGPGGWHVIGRTAATVWDVDREPPALLVPGLRVRFVERP